jgi:hypothetical protein
MASNVTRKNAAHPRGLVWAGGGALLGLVIGLVVGWVVWPVQWVDTDPSDLRHEHQISYVRMVADSLNVSGDKKLAGERLYELTETDADWPGVAVLVDTAANASTRAGDASAADRLRYLAEAVKLPPVVSASAADAGSPVVPRPKGKDTGALYLSAALLLVALALLLWLAVRLLKRGQRQAPKRARASVASAHKPETKTPRARSGFLDALRAEGQEARAALAGHQPSRRVSTALAPSHFEVVAEMAPLPGHGAPPLVDDEEELVPLDEGDGLPVTETADGYVEHVATPSVAVGTPAERVEAVRTAQPAWGEFEAEYRLGDDDFYYAFTLESPAHEFVGQCGIVSSDILSAGQSQHVDAFDVWLFETQGSRTVTKVLVSPFASSDATQSVKLIRRGELVVARPGARVQLEGTGLRLTVQVKDCLYMPVQQADEAVFSQLAVKMIVEPLR